MCGVVLVPNYNVIRQLLGNYLTTGVLLSQFSLILFIIIRAVFKLIYNKLIGNLFLLNTIN